MPLTFDGETLPTPEFTYRAYAGYAPGEPGPLIPAAAIDFGDLAVDAVIEFDRIEDASGGNARIHVWLMRDGEAFERIDLRVPEGDDRQISIASDAPFDAILIGDAEGDVTFRIEPGAVVDATPYMPVFDEVRADAAFLVDAPDGQVTIDFDMIDDASGRKASLDIEFLFAGEVVDTARVKVRDGEDRSLTLASDVAFDTVLVRDGEGDVTFDLARPSDPGIVYAAGVEEYYAEFTVEVGIIG